MADPVKRICDELGVCAEEALCYLDGFGWNLDLAMEACRSKALPLLMVIDSRSILEKGPSQMKTQRIEPFCDVSVDHLPAIGRPNSQRISLSGDETSKELRQYICPLMGLLSSSPSQFLAKQDYLKQVGSSSSSNQSTEVSPPIILNLVSSSRETETTDPPLQGTSRKPEEQTMVNLRRERESTGDPNSTLSVVVVPRGSTTQGDSQQPGDATNQNRWSAYVKKCNEMIAFLIAASLAYMPIRFLIDEQKKYGGSLELADYPQLLFRFFQDFTLTDPFLILALAYVALYILSSASVSRFVVQIAELAAVCSGFGIVFCVIVYIPSVTIYVGFVLFCLSIGAITIREFLLAWRGI